MKSQDFFAGMKTEEDDFAEKVAGAEHFIRLKKQVKMDKEAGLDPRMVSLMGIGGAVGAAGTYLSSRPQKDLGGKSWEEDTLGRQASANKEKPEGGLARKLLNQTVETGHGVAKAFREHPGKASLIGAAGGAMGAMGVGKMLGLALKRGQ